MNIYEKIQAVSQEVGAISKDMNVGGQYKAVSDLNVTLAVNKAEFKYKILSIPLKQELISSEIFRNVDTVQFETNNATTGTKQANSTNNVKITYIETIKMTVRVIDLEDVSSYVDVESFGRGLDSGDKGFGKASTYARKYALLNAYKIPTGEDPDKTASPNYDNPKENDKNVIKKVVDKQEGEAYKAIEEAKTEDEINAVWKNVVYKNMLFVPEFKTAWIAKKTELTTRK